MFPRRALAGLCGLALAACSGGPAETTMPPSATDAVYAAGGDVEYQAGTLPFIITAPHGGLLRPDDVESRTEGNLKNDARTQQLARLVADALTEGDDRPHLVINRLHREKLDANRPLEDATAGDPRAEAAWSAYHELIEEARAEVIATHGRGLLLDVHGHSHDEPRVELGYLVTGSELALDDEALEALAVESSIRHLAASSSLSFVALLRGPASMGARLETAGYASMPSPTHPAPNGLPYFSGGYTLRRHGSSGGEPMDAIQLEAPKEGIRGTLVERAAFAAVVARALRETYALVPP